MTAALFAGLGAPVAHAGAGMVTEYSIPVTTTPAGMATGPDGKIWFVDSGNHVGGTFVGRMTTAGSITSSDVVQLPTSDLGLAATTGPDGNMWVAQDSHIDKVLVGATATSQITSYPLGSGTGGYGSIVTGPDGRLWFGWNQKVGAIATNGTITPYSTPSTTSVEGVIVGPGGKLWFGEGNKIARMDTSGNIGAGDEFSLPSGDGAINALVLGPDGNVWFTLGNPAAIGRITGSGTITIFPTPTASSLPFGIAVGPDQLLWFPERNSDKVGSIPTTASSGADIVEYPVPPPSNKGIANITAGPDNRMWFNEFNANQLGAITTNVAPAGTTYVLAVTRAGSGSGTVTSQPAGISCGATCSATYAAGASVTLAATATAGSTFAGWSGDCSGTATCTLSMTQDHMASARFTAQPATMPLPSGPFVTPPVAASVPPPLGPVPPPVGCVANKLILTDVFPQAGETHLLGVAPPAARGRRVTILSAWNGKPVAEPIVQPDLSFMATAPLPPRSVRRTNRARYVAEFGSVRSLVLKFDRRMFTTAITAAGRTISFSGTVTPPLSAPVQPVVIRASASCSAIAAGTIVATVKPSRSGAFAATLNLPAGLQDAAAVYLRAQTKVRKVTTSKKTFDTFSLIRGIKLAS